MQKKLILFLLLTGIFSQAFADQMTIFYSGAEIRSAPSAMSSKVLASPPALYPVEVLEQGKEYSKITTYRNLTGYVHNSLLKSQPAVVVISDRANVRSGPGTSNEVLFQLSQGMTARLLGKNSGWVELETAAGQKGWIADFLVWGE